MSAIITDAVDAWKTRTLHNADIPLETACSFIGTDKQVFEAKKVNAVEWVLCRKGENTPAIFSYAAVFGSCDPVETGNLVPSGQNVLGMESDRSEPYASFKCSYSYSFDTSADPGLYKAQAKLDGYMQTVPGFNKQNQNPRRAWQSVYNAGSSHRFWMRVPMFIRLRVGEPKTPPPEHLHEWVKAADMESRAYRANPARPKVMALEGQRIRRIEDSQPDQLFRGDAVVFTFSVTYIEGKADWYPVFTLIDIVRVASIQNIWSNSAATASTVVLNSARPALEDGQLIVENNESEGEIEIVGASTVNIGFGGPRKGVANVGIASKLSPDRIRRIDPDVPRSITGKDTATTPQHAIETTQITSKSQPSTPKTRKGTVEIYQSTIKSLQTDTETPPSTIENMQTVSGTTQTTSEISQTASTAETTQTSPETSETVSGSKATRTAIETQQTASESETQQTAPEATQNTPDNTQTIPETTQTIHDAPQLLPDNIRLAANTQQTVAGTDMAAMETPPLVTRTSQTIVGNTRTAFEATNFTFETLRSLPESSHPVFETSQSLEGPMLPALKVTQFDDRATPFAGGDERRVHGRTPSDDMEIREKDGKGKAVAKLRKLTYEDIFGKGEDEDDESTDSSTESSVTTDSAESRRWSDSAVENGAAGSTSRRQGDVVQSDGGHDSKRKKLNSGPPPRRTRARR